MRNYREDRISFCVIRRYARYVLVIVQIHSGNSTNVLNVGIIESEFEGVILCE